MGAKGNRKGMYGDGTEGLKSAHRTQKGERR